MAGRPAPDDFQLSMTEKDKEMPDSHPDSAASGGAQQRQTTVHGHIGTAQNMVMVGGPWHRVQAVSNG